MKTGIKINTLQSVYKKCRFVIHMHEPFVVMKKEHDFCSGRLCWLLFPKLPRVFALAMWAASEKAASSGRPERLCPLMSHGSFHLSMLPLWQVGGWRAPQWQSMLGYMDCESLSRRRSQPWWVWRYLLLGYAGSCFGAARKPTYGALVLVRPLEDVFQHLHFNSSSVFRWRTMAA